MLPVPKQKSEMFKNKGWIGTNQIKTKMPAYINHSWQVFCKSAKDNKECKRQQRVQKTTKSAKDNSFLENISWDIEEEKRVSMIRKKCIICFHITFSFFCCLFEFGQIYARSG